MEYRLLKAFESLFFGTKYLHRRSHLGDHVASFLVDDLYLIDRSQKLKAVVDSHRSVLNTRNKLTGKEHRRGDGMFGAAIPGAVAVAAADHVVHLGEVARVEIGTEVKILAKAMIKQLDRVGTDMLNQLAEFRRHSPSAICVGIVAINYALRYRSFEGAKQWLTDGKTYKHPVQEAEAAERRLLARIEPSFDEVVVLRFEATNLKPFDFAWRDDARTKSLYGATLVRVAEEYERRF